MTNMTIAGIIAVLTLISCVGVYSGKKVKNGNDFLTGGGKAGPGLVCGAILGSLVGGQSTIGTAQLAFHFGLHLCQQLRIGGDEQHLRVGSVFGLREEVGSDEVGTCRGIGNHLHLAGSCRHVDGHIAQRHLLFGTHHILISRTEYLVNFGYGFCSISH